LLVSYLVAMDLAFFDLLRMGKSQTLHQLLFPQSLGNLYTHAPSSLEPLPC